jgi:nicotinate-nucleotide adenylyltransferase
MRVGLFGGSFDPIHRGHLKLANAALRQLKLSRVYFVVSPNSPFKVDRKKTPASERLRLVKIALRGHKAMRAVDWELRRGGVSYTVTTLRSYRRRRPKDDIFLILGSDALKGLPQWRLPHEIVKLVTFVAGRRPGAQWPRLPVDLKVHFYRLRGLFPDVSSTKVRSALAAGRRPGGIDPAVYREIIRRKLYQ